MSREIKDDFKKLNTLDHRKIGEAMDLFFFSEGVGKGLPIWLPNGSILKRTISEYIREIQEKHNFSFIETPVLGNISLYKKSGHYFHYKENIFPSMKIEDSNEEFILRPMACPHHCMVYKKGIHSYKEMPIRYSEFVKQFRYEPSGSLLGLERVRIMELTDNHIFLRRDQIQSELKNIFSMITRILKKFNISLEYIELAIADFEKKNKFFGDREVWTKTEKILEDFLDTTKIKYKKISGEAAFYGPKIDLQIKTHLGHLLTLSTIQLDFFLPEKFNLKYIDSKQEKVFPILIHVGTIGTFERFISVLLEQTKGNLPVWLCPVQAVVIPISNNKDILEYSKKIFKNLEKNKIRVKMDSSGERLSYKIREHQMRKAKYLIVIGDREVKENSVNYRELSKNDSKNIDLNRIMDLFYD